MRGTYWAIRHKPTGGFMPQGRGRGFTCDYPSVRRPPRLFTTERGAKCALRWWLKGRTTVSRGMTGFFEPEYDESWSTVPVASRREEDMEIIQVRVEVS